MAAWIWILIPLTAILMGGFKEWLKFKSKQDKLGTSTHELEGTVRELLEALERSEKQRAALTRRLENLETIVTSETWDALHVGASRNGAPPEAARPEPALSSLIDDEERTEAQERARRMAQQLST